MRRQTLVPIPTRAACSVPLSASSLAQGADGSSGTGGADHAAGAIGLRLPKPPCALCLAFPKRLRMMG